MDNIDEIEVIFKLKERLPAAGNSFVIDEDGQITEITVHAITKITWSYSAGNVPNGVIIRMIASQREIDEEELNDEREESIRGFTFQPEADQAAATT